MEKSEKRFWNKVLAKAIYSKKFNWNMIRAEIGLFWAILTPTEQQHKQTQIKALFRILQKLNKHIFGQLLEPTFM